MKQSVCKQPTVVQFHNHETLRVEVTKPFNWSLVLWNVCLQLPSKNVFWWHSGKALGSQSKDLGFHTSSGHIEDSILGQDVGKMLAHIAPLSTQEYEWVPGL